MLKEDISYLFLYLGVFLGVGDLNICGFGYQCEYLYVDLRIYGIVVLMVSGHNLR